MLSGFLWMPFVPAGEAEYLEGEMEVEFLVADEIRHKDYTLKTISDLKNITVVTLGMYRNLLNAKKIGTLGHILYSRDVEKITNYLAEINCLDGNDPIGTLYDSRGELIEL